MSRKILDFQNGGSGTAELWGDLASLPDFYIQGIAHADIDGDIVRLTLYNTSGIVGASGEIANAVARLVASKGTVARLILELQEVEASSVKQDVLVSGASQNLANKAEKSALPTLGPRIA